MEVVVAVPIPAESSGGGGEIKGNVDNVRVDPAFFALAALARAPSQRERPWKWVIGFK
ncbi:hypothetical protein HDZ31DRAFT_68705 [Schizophyllum fasciatum]